MVMIIIVSEHGPAAPGYTMTCFNTTIVLLDIHNNNNNNINIDDNQLLVLVNILGCIS